MNPESAGLNNIAVPVRTFNAGNMDALRLNTATLGEANGAIAGPLIGYGNNRAYYVSPNTTYPNNHVNTGYTEDSTYTIVNYLQNYLNPCPEYMVPYYAMQPRMSNNRLLSEFVRVKFWSFQHMSKMLIGLRLGDWATKVVHQTLNYDGSVKDEYEEGLMSTVLSYARGY